MSQKNVELVRRSYASAPDLRDTDPRDDRAFADRAFRDYLDERVELRLSERSRWPEGEMVFRGREGFAAFFAMLRDTWDEWRFEPERFFDAGDRIVVFVRVVGKASASGLPIDVPTAHVVDVRDGRITLVRAYLDRSEALEAVGLRE